LNSDGGTTGPIAGEGFEPRHVPLSGSRSLTVRPVTDDDVDGLVALYETLDDDDRYTRFFSLYRPDRGFFERLAAVGRRGGFGLVAEVSAAGSPHRSIVGEANYTPLANGNGELAITIAEPWRGWLGPYLLDALLDAAAARGVPNLEADILVTNRSMLALARARGYVTTAHPDWSQVRVSIGTASRTPSWPSEHRRTRVLVEVPGGRWHGDAAARAAGVEVLACPGPAANRRCPALAGRRCPLAKDADAIVMVPPAVDDRWTELLAAHARLHDAVPVYVELADPEAAVPEGATATPRDDRVVLALVQRTQTEGTRSDT
jgi:hypothetical protein